MVDVEEGKDGRTELVQRVARSNHHRLVGPDAEKAQDNVVEPSAEDGRPSLKVAASETTSQRALDGSTRRRERKRTNIPQPWSSSPPLRCRLARYRAISTRHSCGTGLLVT